MSRTDVKVTLTPFRRATAFELPQELRDRQERIPGAAIPAQGRYDRKAQDASTRSLGALIRAFALAWAGFRDAVSCRI